MRTREFFRVLGLAFLAASLGGIFPSAAQDDSYRDIHSIGVISAFGNDVRLQNWGVTRFTNDSTNLNPDWALDAEVSDLVVNALRSRFAVKNVQADTLAMRSMMVKPLFPDRGDVTKYLQSLPSSGVDAYVVVLPDKNSFLTPFGPYATEGLGAYRREGLFSSNVPIVPYAAYEVMVVEAKTGKLIAWSSDSGLENRAHSGMMSSMCDKSFGAKTMLQLTDAQKAIVRAEVRFLVLSSLPLALKNVGLPSGAGLDNAALARPPICLTP